jgi:hypothetical protein
MFSEHPPFDDLLASYARRKVKKALYREAKQLFSDLLSNRGFTTSMCTRLCRVHQAKTLTNSLKYKKPLDVAMKFIEDTSNTLTYSSSTVFENNAQGTNKHELPRGNESA